MSPIRKKIPKLAGLKRPPSHAAPRRGTTLLGSAFGAGGAPLGLPSLWPALDQTQMHFRKGELSLLAGRSAHGKSNFLLNLMLNWLEQDPSAEVYFCSLEMTPQQLAARLLTILVAKDSGTSLSSVQALKFLAQGKVIPPVAASLEKLRRLEERLHFAYEPLSSVEQLVHDVRSRASSFSAILVDPLSSLSVATEKARQNRRDLELSQVCGRLKELAVRLACPVLGAVPTRLMRHEEGEEMRALIAKGREFQHGDGRRHPRPAPPSDSFGRREPRSRSRHGPGRAFLSFGFPTGDGAGPPPALPE